MVPLNQDQIETLLKSTERKATRFVDLDKPRPKYHGLSINEYEALKKSQNGYCFICGKRDKLELDHNHTTRKARKFLCRWCNQRLAYIETWLRTVDIEDVAAYLELHQ